MKTLVVNYSKTGNSRKVAEAVIKELDCDYGEILYDEETKTLQKSPDPSGYERVILICPIWAFSLAEPMKIYINKQKGNIDNYDLIVTYSLFGLRGCVNNCKAAIGKPPGKALKIKSKDIKAGNFDITAAL